MALPILLTACAPSGITGDDGPERSDVSLRRIDQAARMRQLLAVSTPPRQAAMVFGVETVCWRISADAVQTRSHILSVLVRPQVSVPLHRTLAVYAA